MSKGSSKENPKNTPKGKEKGKDKKEKLKKGSESKEDEALPQAFKVFMTEYDSDVRYVQSQLLSEHWTPPACVGILNDLVGRNGERSTNCYNQWRTTMPFMGSLVAYLITGNPFAPGNPHVEQTDHTVNGRQVMTANAYFHQVNWTVDEIAILCESIRALYPFTEIQRSASRGTEFQNYEKHLVVIDHENTITYLIKTRWHHTARGDTISAEVRLFLQDVEIPEHPTLNALFEAMGFN